MRCSLRSSVAALFRLTVGGVEVAGELVVDVNAANYEAGSDTWTNAGNYTDLPTE